MHKRAQCFISKEVAMQNGVLRRCLIGALLIVVISLLLVATFYLVAIVAEFVRNHLPLLIMIAEVIALASFVVAVAFALKKMFFGEICNEG